MRCGRLSAGSAERSILVERKVRAYPIVVGLVIGEQMAKMLSPNTTTWSRHSRRIDPISRST